MLVEAGSFEGSLKEPFPAKFNGIITETAGCYTCAAPQFAGLQRNTLGTCSEWDVIEHSSCIWLYYKSTIPISWTTEVAQSLQIGSGHS